MPAAVKVALIGGGLMGSFHAETLARRLPSASFVALADPLEAPARALLARLALDHTRYEPDYQTVLADPEIEAVVIATPGATHPALITAAAQAGKAVFCEKPLGHALDAADAALAAVAQAGTLLQLGFQRRFDAGFQRAQALVADGSLGRIELLRSLTRDPAGPQPAAAVPWAIFRETLIHDFDVLRWLAASEVVELYAQADAFAATNRGTPGALDTALVQLRFANGALATADASFHAAYGYDVRAEVFGSGGMITVGDGRLDSATQYSAAGAARPQAHWFQDLFAAAYTAELAHFVECVRTGTQPVVTGQDGRASLAIATAAIESIETGRPVRVGE